MLVNNPFYKNNFIREHEANFCAKVRNKLRTISASAEEQSLKFAIKVVNKTVASAPQFAKCFMLIYVYNCSSQLREQHKHTNFIAYLTSWHNSIFGYKLRKD